MKSFPPVAYWLRCALFAALLLLPVAAGEWYVRSLPNPAKAKHAFLAARSHEVDTLILGNSHAYYGLAPELLGSHAFSAAQVSQTLRYDAWVLAHYPFPRLRVVVLTLSDFSLYEELEEGDEWFLANRYRLYMDCDFHSCLSVYGWEVTAFRPFCEKLASLCRPPRMRWSAAGQGLEYTLESRAPGLAWDNGPERAAANDYADLSLSRRGMGYLETIARYCEARGLTLALVATPLTRSYRAARSAARVADTRRCLAALLRRHPSVRYYDYSEAAAFTAADFYDADHLNLDGSHKLSRLLRRDMSRACRVEAP